MLNMLGHCCDLAQSPLIAEKERFSRDLSSSSTSPYLNEAGVALYKSCTASPGAEILNGRTGFHVAAQ